MTVTENYAPALRPDSLAYRLAMGDWSEMTIPEIAEELQTSAANVSSTMRYVRNVTGVPVRYKKRPPHNRWAVEAKPYVPTADERHTALALEAHRRGVSYGQLASALSFSEVDRIVDAYIEQKQKDETQKKRRKKQVCTGCAYWVHGSCSFYVFYNRLRRRDADGLCLERTAEKRRRFWIGE